MKHPIFLVLFLGLSARTMAQSADSAATQTTKTAIPEKKTRVILADDPSDTPDEFTSDPEGPRASAMGSLSVLKTARIGLIFPKEPSGTTINSLFRHFEVLDERPDTARIGVHADRHNLAATRVRQLIFDHPASEEIASYLNTRFSRSGGAFTALVVIRTLWLSDANNLSEDMVQNPDKYDERRKIHLKAEIYAGKDGQYTPILRFDSLQVALEGNYERFGDDLSDMLEDLADSSSLLLSQKGGEGRKISRADILQYNQSRFDTPVCRDSTLNKGVYLSFEEFKDNAPSIKEYEFKKVKDNLVLYVKEPGGHSYYSHNAWGYCDGTMVYIMNDGMLVPAWKEGKAWYLYGRVHIYNPKGNKEILGYLNYSDPTYLANKTVLETSTTGLLHTQVVGIVPSYGFGNRSLIKSKGRTQRHIFTVDMDTGKIY